MKLAAVNDRRMFRLAMRPKLLPFLIRKARLVSLAVALPPVSMLFATPIVAQMTSLSHFASVMLALVKNRGGGRKPFVAGRNRGA
jgi:hypothetical protein